MTRGCRTSGALTASALIFSGPCKLISIHGAETAGGGAESLTLYDNTAGIGTIVATMMVASGTSIEFDMHGVICKTGLYAVIAGPGTGSFTVEFA